MINGSGASFVSIFQERFAVQFQLSKVSDGEVAGRPEATVTFKY